MDKLITYFEANWTRLLITGLVLFVLVLAVVLIWIYIYQNRHQKKFQKKIYTKTNNVRVFTFFGKENKVKFFDITDMKNNHIITFDQFYKTFDPQEINKVKQWIASIFSGNGSVSRFLETRTIITGERKSYFTLLECTKFDLENLVAHVESHLLPFLVPETSKKSGTDINSLDELSSSMSSSFKPNGRTKGAIYDIKLFSTFEYKSNYSQSMSKYLRVQFTNLISPYLSSNRQLSVVSDSELVILDKTLPTRDMAYSFGHTILQLLTKYLHLNSYNDSFDVAIGVALTTPNEIDFKKQLKKARTIAVTAQQSSYELKIAIYEENSDMGKVRDNAILEDLNKLINQKSFHYFYDPIVDAKKGVISSYLLSVSPFNSVFTTYDEVLDYAFNVGGSDNLLDFSLTYACQNYLYSPLAYQKPLFISLKLAYITFVARLLSSKFPTLLPTLILKDEDLFTWTEEKQSPLPILTFAKTQHLSLALEVTSDSYIIATEILHQFDYFVFSPTVTSEIKNNVRKRFILHSMVERLNDYKKPFLVTNVETFSDLEIIFKEDINLVSGNFLSTSSESLKDVTNKKLNKVVELKEHF